jgi:hypothetical protein
VGALTSLCCPNRGGGKNGIALVRAIDTSIVITLGGEGIPALGECTRFAVILSHMVIVVAPAAWARVRLETRVQKRSWAWATPFSRWVACAQERGLVIVHGRVALFLEVIALAIILLFVGLAALRVLILATRTIVALIVLMPIVGSLIVVIVLVALMVVAILVATVLLVAWFMARCSGKMSCLLFFWLHFVFGNLFKNASHCVGRLTLFEESN